MFTTNLELNGHSSAIYRSGIPYIISLLLLAYILLFVVKRFHILYRLATLQLKFLHMNTIKACKAGNCESLFGSEGKDMKQ